MTPRIEQLAPKILVGIRMRMSLIQNKTGALWKYFIPRREAIDHQAGTEVISLQKYPADYFSSFRPDREFEKWACLEVTKLEKLPEEMESLTLEGGLYAVFDYKGSSTDTSIFQYIYNTWLPQSDYQLEDRPHFEVLGTKYKNADPDSEEEIWIPIKAK